MSKLPVCPPKPHVKAAPASQNKAAPPLKNKGQG